MIDEAGRAMFRQQLARAWLLKCFVSLLRAWSQLRHALAPALGMHHRQLGTQARLIPPLHQAELKCAAGNVLHPEEIRKVPPRPNVRSRLARMKSRTTSFVPWFATRWCAQCINILHGHLLEQRLQPQRSEYFIARMCSNLPNDADRDSYHFRRLHLYMLER